MLFEQIPKAKNRIILKIRRLKLRIMMLVRMKRKRIRSMESLEEQYNMQKLSKFNELIEMYVEKSKRNEN